MSDGKQLPPIALRETEDLGLPRGPAAPAPSGRIGRFTVLEKLGEGATGVVLAAYDPQLDRKVALKLLAAPSPEATERLLVEARAMAQLTHPHVLAVHEVGTSPSGAYVAMEHAAGGDLRAWCAAAPRAPREIVAKFVQAGAGLHAAHQAGLVHRDFKPENVLLTRDGTVRVADFGIAGTPAFMAPEQRRREPLGPASDQYAFCVSLWHALTGEWPEEGELPARLREVLGRGLRADPAERWPSMAALSAAISVDPAGRRRRAIAGAVGVALLGALAALGLTRAVGGGPAPCQGMDAPLAGVWDARRAEAAFAATGRPYAAETFTRVAQRLDGYQREWVEARVEACQAHARGERSERLLDLSMDCLDRRLAEVRALAGVFERAEATTVDNAVDASVKLAPVAQCREVAAQDAPPPAARATVDALRARLAAALALERTGQWRDGLAEAQRVAREAEALGFAPLTAEALARRGALEELTSDSPAAEATLRQALLFAADARDDVLATRIWIELVRVIGDSLARADEALQLRVSAEAVLRRAGRAAELEAGLWRSVGLAQRRKGRYEEARVSLERALEIRQRILPPDHPDVAMSLNNLASAYAALGRFDEAQRRYEAALAIFEKALGREHPLVAMTLNNLGGALDDQDRSEEALAPHLRALAIREKVLGTAHVSYGSSLNNLGKVYEKLGRYEEARQHHERARAVFEKALGPDHPRVAMSLNNLGSVLVNEGRPAEAVDALTRALAIDEKALGVDHPDCAYSLLSLGDARRALGQLDESRRELERALALREKLGPDHPEVAEALTSLAATLLLLGRAAEARAAAERAVAIGEKAGGAASLAASRFVLARALWESRETRARAVALAEDARQALAGRPRAADVEAWLESHR